ncbi:hypothetical protein K432DRAFT_405899 [Lepidopterella palustris CBS 459.81]|uniref:Uncharacterized protein n=1 Tax=Lepidopterella palustris CBS 459.81 TaxID=1314670 RepID=A0A8E2JE72_9PEZI|nr:hypothetical protein K432DRAFT_405899 [Lepidopterella palustris CBS 459.81]
MKAMVLFVSTVELRCDSADAYLAALPPSRNHGSSWEHDSPSSTLGRTQVPSVQEFAICLCRGLSSLLAPSSRIGLKLVPAIAVAPYLRLAPIHAAKQELSVLLKVRPDFEF